MIEFNFESPEEMTNSLREWNEAYSLGFPQVDDGTYDHFKRVLQKQDPTNEFLKEVGNKPKVNKEFLPFQMGSLKNKTADDIVAWLVKNPSKVYILSHKLDGIGIETQYKNGDFHKAWLRGDGTIGENITEKAKTFVPKHILSDRPLVTLVGEIVLEVDHVLLGYKNKRNGVAGIIHRESSKHLEHLSVIFHGWKDPDGAAITSEELRMAEIHSMTSRGVRYMLVYSDSDIPDSDVETMALKLLAEDTDYDKDGVVISVDDCEVEHVKLPEKKIAYKANKMIAETSVKMVEWNPSRTGKHIPLVYVEPVDLGGATIGKCTGFNAKFILENAIGVGAIIKVVRSGDVIPYIDGVIQKASTVLWPKVCNSCGTTLDSESVHLVCNNANCTTKIQKGIAHFFERLGLEFFSEKMLTSLGCGSIIDVFNLKQGDIERLSGWGETSASDFVKRISEIKTTNSEKLLSALGIDGLGRTTSKLLLENFSYDDILSKCVMDVFCDDLVKIKGIGAKTATRIVNGLRSNLDLLEQLKKIGIDTCSNTVGSLTGHSFCITGKLSRPRKEIEKWVEDNGGRNASISSCTYLVCNEPSDTGKYKKAMDKGIPILTEEQLVEMHMKARKTI